MLSAEELAAVYRASGRKVTPQRLAVFQALNADPEHPSAERVFAAVQAQLPTVSLRTVYQTLNDLTELGELSPVDLGTGSARFDPNLDPHHHLVCDSCGKVRDVFTDFDQVALADADTEGFTVSSTQIVFRGRCAACQADHDHADARAVTP